MNRMKGFTLIEIAVVLVIIGLLLGSILGPLSAQQERKNVTSTENLILEVQQSITGYIAQNGHLPCPAVNADGVESRPGGPDTDCLDEHGFVPNVSLGLNGVVDNNNQIIDFWGQPIRYSITQPAGAWVYAIPGVTLNTITAAVPDLQVSSSEPCNPGDEIAQEVVAVIYSVGPDSNTAPASADQAENVVTLDNCFVSREPSEAAGNEFDDILVWISSNALAYTLLESGRTD